MIINYKRKFIKVEEIWGKRKSKREMKVDLSMNVSLLLSAPQKPLVIKRGNTEYLEINVPNFLINVCQDEELIYKKIHKSTRADIRKAMVKDELIYYETDHPTDEQIIEFTLLYNSFAKEKKIPFCVRERLLEIRNNHLLIMTSVADKQNNTLCASMLLVDPDFKQLYGLYGFTARLSKACDKEKRLIARANKYLTWNEILLAKKIGLDWYNFGGEVYQEEDRGVNDFKRRFGTIRGYDCRRYTPKNMLGKIFIYLLYLKWNKIFHSHIFSCTDKKPLKIPSNGDF